ncbi:MAG: ParB/RepB/Spo0J family partition protein [Bacillota bacterium]|nr:ParB/RepB/Spo0J family partition protein [Candidatus Fermentithermobacillaceae bacterium]HOA71348.1 ParB/RepB/Spo0J family partition protein [Bacillota bacterium]HPZ85873.1 ParB/RepB/Spo0J family partition protein [Bacillota bacterium]HQD86409.1 ParB/RepB/Spo0J family partition protein [Bacillota bacterium]
MARRGLGRGIDSLIPAVLPEEGEEILHVSPGDIRPNPYQPRQIFDEAAIEELAASMKEHGVIQPLIVRRDGPGYQLVAGERRLRAAIKAGLDKIPVVVKSLSDREAMELSLVENLQREDLGPIEEAEAYKRLSEEFGLTQEQIAQRVGKSRSDVANTMRLLRLEPEIKQLINEGKISGGHGRALVGLPREQQLVVAKAIVDKGLSVRETEEAVASKAAKRKPRQKQTSSSRIKEAEEILSAALGSPVVVKRQGTKGTISISFFGREDLERLIDIIAGTITTS